MKSSVSILGVSNTTEVDVWSIGCILAELLLGKPMFKGREYVDNRLRQIGILTDSLLVMVYLLHRFPF